jgi:hypothetical protein
MYVALVGCWSVASVGAVQRQVWSRGQSRSDCLRCGPSPLTQSGHKRLFDLAVGNDELPHPMLPSEYAQ